MFSGSWRLFHHKDDVGCLMTLIQGTWGRTGMTNQLHPLKLDKCWYILGRSLGYYDLFPAGLLFSRTNAGGPLIQFVLTARIWLMLLGPNASCGLAVGWVM